MGLREQACGHDQLTNCRDGSMHKSPGLTLGVFTHTNFLQNRVPKNFSVIEIGSRL